MTHFLPFTELFGELTVTEKEMIPVLSVKQGLILFSISLTCHVRVHRTNVCWLGRPDHPSRDLIQPGLRIMKRIKRAWNFVFYRRLFRYKIDFNRRIVLYWIPFTPDCHKLSYQEGFKNTGDSTLDRLTRTLPCVRSSDENETVKVEYAQLFVILQQFPAI